MKQKSSRVTNQGSIFNSWSETVCFIHSHQRYIVLIWQNEKFFHKFYCFLCLNLNLTHAFIRLFLLLFSITLNWTLKDHQSCGAPKENCCSAFCSIFVPSKAIYNKQTSNIIYLNSIPTLQAPLNSSRQEVCVFTRIQ